MLRVAGSDNQCWPSGILLVYYSLLNLSFQQSRHYHGHTVHSAITVFIPSRVTKGEASISLGHFL